MAARIRFDIGWYGSPPLFKLHPDGYVVGVINFSVDTLVTRPTAPGLHYTTNALINRIGRIQDFKPEMYSDKWTWLELPSEYQTITKNMVRVTYMYQGGVWATEYYGEPTQ